MSIKRKRSRRHTKLTGWQRFHLDIRTSAGETYGEVLKTFVAFHSPEHRRQVWEANREQILAERDPVLPGHRPSAWWEYDFPAIYAANPHLDKWGLVRLSDDGIPRPYQSDADGNRELDILHCFGLLSPKETLALRFEYPRGDEWRCPRFLQRDKPEPEMR